MDISRFFIDRPRFAGVISIFVFLIGLLAIVQLPVSEYPEVAPPQIVVRAQFPGANPRVISETVATPLEEQINGVENLLYFDSQAAADGEPDAHRDLQEDRPSAVSAETSWSRTPNIPRPRPLQVNISAPAGVANPSA